MTAGAVGRLDLLTVARRSVRTGVEERLGSKWMGRPPGRLSSSATVFVIHVPPPGLVVACTSCPFTATQSVLVGQVAAGEITAVHIQNVGHLIAQEAPEQLAAKILEFTGRVDAE